MMSPVLGSHQTRSHGNVSGLLGCPCRGCFGLNGLSSSRSYPLLYESLPVVFSPSLAVPKSIGLLARLGCSGSHKRATNPEKAGFDSQPRFALSGEQLLNPSWGLPISRLSRPTVVRRAGLNGCSLTALCLGSLGSLRGISVCVNVVCGVSVCVRYVYAYARLLEQIAVGEAAANRIPVSQ